MEATMEKIEVEELRQNGRQWLAGLQGTSGDFEKGQWFTPQVRQGL